MSFCGPNQILQAFCDFSSLVDLVCEQPSYLYTATYIAAVVVLYVPLGFIIFSYICIVITVLHMVNGQVNGIFFLNVYNTTVFILQNVSCKKKNNSCCCSQGRRKTFSTCTTQGFIISSFYIPRFFVYTAPYIHNFQTTIDGRMATTFFYSFFPPLINPFVYCLRTKEIQEIFKHWIQKRRSNKSNPGRNVTVPELHW